MYCAVFVVFLMTPMGFPWDTAARVITVNPWAIYRSAKSSSERSIDDPLPTYVGTMGIYSIQINGQLMGELWTVSHGPACSAMGEPWVTRRPPMVDSTNVGMFYDISRCTMWRMRFSRMMGTVTA